MERIGLHSRSVFLYSYQEVRCLFLVKSARGVCGALGARGALGHSLTTSGQPESNGPLVRRELGQPVVLMRVGRVDRASDRPRLELRPVVNEVDVVILSQTASVGFPSVGFAPHV